MKEPTERQRAFGIFISDQNEALGRDFPIKNLTFAEVQTVLEWLDSYRPGWDRNLWYEGFVGMVDLDLAWDVFMPAVAQVLPQCVKQGFSPPEMPPA